MNTEGCVAEVTAAAGRYLPQCCYPNWEPCAFCYWPPYYVYIRVHVY